MDSCLFKYKNSFLFNIVSILFVILFMLICILIIEFIKENLMKLIAILFILLFLAMWMYFVKKKIEITYGEFRFDKKEFAYTTMKKTYFIKYNEIDYIKKETYIEDNIIYHQESTLYKIKIKNAGIFIFRTYDNTLDEAMELLSFKSKVNII